MNLLKGFYIYAVFTSLLTIINNISNLLVPSTIVSLFGIIGATLFLLKKPSSYFFILIWIFAQIPFFTIGDFTYNTSQLIDFHLFFSVGKMYLGVNMQVLFLLLLKPIYLSEFLYQKVTFKAYSEHEKLDRVNEYTFIPTDIKTNKLISYSEIIIKNETYTKIEFELIKDSRIKKAGIQLTSLNGNTINTTVQYKLNNANW